MEEIKINIVEAASTLAHAELLTWVSLETDLYKDPEAEVTEYTEYFQENFDELYDKYYDLLKPLFKD